ncbi:unnamed protein product [Periconia digitata]|uniref:Thioredoxin-like fold domain-containing protein n=1 Tax=Periconia digitata TaxID=1303443 RepID=A0A9W4U852_9PLEO|nr:unnamed protein product [Periconia digitata]
MFRSYPTIAHNKTVEHHIREHVFFAGHCVLPFDRLFIISKPFVVISCQTESILSSSSIHTTNISPPSPRALYTSYQPTIMALAPKFAGQKLSIQPKAVHTLELYLDYVCPFSAKLFNTLYNTSLKSTLLETYPHSLVTIFRQQIQPWHPSSTLVHEAAYAVQRLSPSHFYAFSAALFARQTEYFDVNVVNETRNQTYKRLAALAGDVGVDEAKVYELLAISERPGADGSLNAGNGVTADVKVQVRANRLVGVHVTPTVVFDGVVRDEIGSSWGVEQWEEWLGKNVDK